MEPVVIFLHQLAQSSDKSFEAILGDILEFTTHLCITNFSDPLAVDMSRGISSLQAACDYLLRFCSSTKMGLEILSKHELCLLWPTALPTLPFTSLPVEQLP